jgi:hypothetical protein
MPPVQVIAAFVEFGEPGGSIRDAVNRLSPSERESVATYLEGGVLVSAVPGSGNDVLDGEPVALPPSLRSDGHFIWRSDLVHYVRKYGVGLADDFLAHVRSGSMPPTELDVESDREVTNWLKSRFGQP